MATTNESILIRSAQETDFASIEKLCTEQFGAGYLAKSDFEEWLKNPELFLVAEEGNRFCGFCYFMPESEKALADYMKIERKTVEEASGGKPVLHCRSAALASEAEHKGLMHRMLLQEIEKAKELGFGAAFAPAWTYNGIIPMGHLMDILGFEKIGVRDNLWVDQENYTCVVCGGKCHCQAVIYKKVF